MAMQVKYGELMTNDKEKKKQGIKEVYCGKAGNYKLYYKHNNDEKLCLLPVSLRGLADLNLVTYLKYLDGDKESLRRWNIILGAAQPWDDPDNKDDNKKD